MCGTIEFIAFDGLIIIGVLLLVAWILTLCGVVTVGKSSLLLLSPFVLSLPKKVSLKGSRPGS